MKQASRIITAKYTPVIVQVADIGKILRTRGEPGQVGVILEINIVNPVHALSVDKFDITTNHITGIITSNKAMTAL